MSEKEEGFARVTLHKRKVDALVAATPNRVKKKVQPTPEPRESIIPSLIPRRIKTKTTKVNPKIGEKGWAISFKGNKENQASSSDSKSTDDTPIVSL